MNKLIGFVVLLSLGVAGAQNPGTGVGVIVGDPTGLSLKHWLTGTTAFDVAAAWSVGDNDRLHLHADYLVHDFNSLKAEKGRLAWYYGIGGRFVAREDNNRRGRDNNEDDSFGARIPVGLDYIFQGDRLNAFLELAPALELVPDTDLDFDLGLGLRYLFH
jgi:hypothetical protein